MAKGSNTILYVILGVVALLVVSAACCGGMVFWGYSFGMGVLQGAVQQALEQDPVAEEHLGQIQSVKVNLVATGEASQDEDGDVLVFDVEGSKGKGQVLVKQNKSGQGAEWIRLRTPSGETVDLDAGNFEIAPQ